MDSRRHALRRRPAARPGHSPGRSRPVRAVVPDACAGADLQSPRPSATSPLVGVDDLPARRLTSDGDWTLAIDIGLGDRPATFDSVLLRFPGPSTAIRSLPGRPAAGHHGPCHLKPSPTWRHATVSAAEQNSSARPSAPPSPASPRPTSRSRSHPGTPRRNRPRLSYAQPRLYDHPGRPRTAGPDHQRATAA